MRRSTESAATPRDWYELKRLMRAELEGDDEPELYVDDLIRLSRAGYVSVDPAGTPHLTNLGRESVARGRN